MLQLGEKSGFCYCHCSTTSTTVSNSVSGWLGAYVSVTGLEGGKLLSVLEAPSLVTSLWRWLASRSDGRTRRRPTCPAINGISWSGAVRERPVAPLKIDALESLSLR
jgi:hypothetical protein